MAMCGLCGDEGDKVYHRGMWWDSDDGWKRSALCPSCWKEVRLDRPHPNDYAFDKAELSRDACRAITSVVEDGLETDALVSEMVWG